MNTYQSPAYPAKISPTAKIVIIVAAFFLAGLIGAVGLFYDSPYAPLLVGAGIVGAVLVLVWMQKPVWALYAAIFLVLLPVGLIPPSAQSLLNRAVTLIAAATWLANFLLVRFRMRLTPSTLLMLGFIFWAGLSLFWGHDMAAGIQDLQSYTLRFLVFIFLITNEIRTKKDFDNLMMMLAVVGWIFVTASVITAATQGYTPGTRLKVLSTNENQIGFMALISLVGALWSATRRGGKHKLLRIIVGIGFILISLLAVAMSGSRGGAISWAVTLVCFLLFRPTRKWGGIAVAILMLMMAFAPFFFTTTINRFMTEESTPLGRREDLWLAGTRMIQDHPWIGVGIGNTATGVLPYLQVLGLSTLNNQDGVSLHNPVLVVWGDTGLIGFALYAGMVISALLSFVVTFFQHRREKIRYLMPYYALVAPVFVGFMLSWFKGGGLEQAFTFFLLLSFLLIPAAIDPNTLREGKPALPHEPAQTGQQNG